MKPLTGLVRRKNGVYGLPSRVLKAKKTATYNGKRYIRIGGTWRLESQLKNPMDPQHHEYKEFLKNSRKN